MGSVLENLDPYLGTWTRTREPVLVYVLKSWLNIDGTYGNFDPPKFELNKLTDTNKDSLRSLRSSKEFHHIFGRV